MDEGDEASKMRRNPSNVVVVVVLRGREGQGKLILMMTILLN